MSRRTRSWRTFRPVLLLALALTTLAIAAQAWSGDAPAWGTLARRAARSAHALGVRDEGHLHFIRSSGSQLIDEGPATGTLPGKVRVHFTYDGNPTVIAQFTIFSARGSVSGRAQGRLSNPTSLTPSFRGSLTIISGSGRYAHVTGQGELFGVYFRRNYGLTVQTIVTLEY